MDGHLKDGLVYVGGDARQRFHQSRGYGRPRDDEVALAPVEAAHLLYRGDLDTVEGDDFEAFLAAQEAGFFPRFLVYSDLRSRGFYLSPARSDWVDDPRSADFVVYPRGAGPSDGEIAHRVRVVDERDRVPMASVTEAVLAVVDEESEITYLQVDTTMPTGDGTPEPPGVVGRLLGDRVLVWDPPAGLHGDGFYGQPLEGPSEQPVVQLSLVEAAYLAADGILTVAADPAVAAIVDRGRDVEGDRFDRRLRAYRALRARGLIPKTGFKFGADFRVYPSFESPTDLGHSETLVRVAGADHHARPRDLALDVRLAHGVRKTMAYALVAETVSWRTLHRLTP